MTIRSPHSLMLSAVLSLLALPALAVDDPVVAVVNGKDVHR